MKEDCKKMTSDYINNFKNSVNINEMWTNLKDEIKKMTDKHVPQRTINHNHGYPWITTKLRRIFRKRDRLYSKKQRTGNTKANEEYKQFKHLVQKESRKTYWNYISNIIAPDDKPNPKKFFSYLKSTRKEATGIPPLKQNGITSNNTQDKANALNEQFKSVFTEDHDSRMPDMGRSDYNIMDDIYITNNGVEKLLKDLNPNKASGPDQLTPRILKELHKELAPAITLLFQRSLSIGETPNDWKHAFVCPIYKKGARHNPANYRPVSLTCILCKLMEHIIVSNLMKHLDRNNILSEFQHGFRNNRSCETQLTGLIQDLTSTMDKKMQTDMIVLDFAKAFDKVSHPRLMHKLQHYGITGRTHRWIEAFLNNRTQAVVIDKSFQTKGM